MLAVLFALLAGVLTIATPCSLPVLPILLGASIGRTSVARPALIALGGKAYQINIGRRNT
jgi:cytochrome c biogenesis protein CcdA